MPSLDPAQHERITQPYEHELAELYDLAVPDWPGEIAFYRNLAARASADAPILELGSGTGRIAIPLAQGGHRVLGMDISEEMLTIARAKSIGLPDLHWIRADMRTFELDERFGLALVPAYSFQLLLTKEDQSACLERIARHLISGARLALHLETHPSDWLASLPSGTFTRLAPAGETRRSAGGERIRVSYAWSYDALASILSVITRYETIGGSRKPVTRIERGPLKMHRTCPRILADLLTRSGFETEAVYGDFYRASFDSESEEMIWIARLGN
jgi:SAM-dependent methyltransferase